MQVSYATQAGDARIENEDFVAAGAHVVVVLDGVTPVDRADTGCHHGVAWFARRVGIHLLAAATTGDRDLTDCLADAIDACRRAHQAGCDLSHPDRPAAAVAAVRLRAEVAEYLVLADCTVVVDRARSPGSDAAGEQVTDLAGPQVITDNRPSEVGRRVSATGPRLPAREFRATYCNRPDGYWVAAEDPAAAGAALTGTLDLDPVRRLLVATDGATRMVDLFGRFTWPEALDLVEESGPAAWIERTRSYEADLAGSGGAPGKPHDDATAVLLVK